MSLSRKEMINIFKSAGLLNESAETLDIPTESGKNIYASQWGKDEGNKLYGLELKVFFHINDDLEIQKAIRVAKAIKAALDEDEKEK